MSVMRWPAPFNEQVCLAEGAVARAMGLLSRAVLDCEKTPCAIIFLTARKKDFLR